MTADEFAEHVEAAGIELAQSNNGRRGNCPACGEDRALIIFNRDDMNDRVRFKCWACDDGNAILSALDLTWRDIYGKDEPVSGAEEIRAAILDGSQDIEADVAEVEELPGGCGLLYGGQAVNLFAERGAGKTVVAVILACSVAAAGGRVLYLDRENGPQLLRPHVEGVFETHGMPDLLEQGRLVVRHWPMLDRNWDPAEYGKAFGDFNLVVYDSLREFIAQLGGNPNHDEAVSAFVDLAVSPIRSRGGAVLVCDNTGHEFTDRPKGSGAKLDAFPAAVKVVCLEEFSQIKRGSLELQVTRSRHGDIGRLWSVSVGDEHWGLPEALDESPGERARRREASAKQRFRDAVLAEVGEEPIGRDLLLKTLRERGLKGGEAKWRRWLKDWLAEPSAEIVKTGSRGRNSGIRKAEINPDVNPDNKPGQTPYMCETHTAAENGLSGFAGGASTSPVFFDLETGGLDSRGDQLVLAAFKQDGEREVLYHPADRERIQAWLRRPATYVAHNAKFDLGFLAANGYELPSAGQWDDSLLVAHIAGARLPGQAALKRVAAEAVKAGDLSEDVLEPEKRIKRWRSSARRRATKAGTAKPELGDAPRDLLEPYALQDVELTEWTYEHYGQRINGQGDVLELERRLAPALFSAEQRGIPLDIESAHEFRDQVQANMEARLAEAKELAGNPSFNIAAAADQIEAFERRGVDLDNLPRTKKTGQPSLVADNLKLIRDPLAEAITAYRKEKRLLDYAHGLFRVSHGDRFYPSWRQCGAATGRMSSSPNTQNLPKGDLRVRHLIAAGEGKILVGADLDQIEMRVLAHYARGGRLEEAFADGVDVHQQVADNLAISRDEAKTLNYATQYGCGSKRVALILASDQKRGREVLDGWYDLYPEVARLKREIHRVLKTRGYIRTLLGREHRLPLDKAYVGLNYVVQGSAADLFKSSVVEADAAGLGQVLFCHDEILCEVPEDDADRVAKQLVELLTSGPIAGLTAEAKIAKRWSEL